MEFLITSKGAININHIVFIQLAEVKEAEEGYSDLRIDIMQTNGSILNDLAKNYFQDPCIGNKMLFITTTQNQRREITFKNQEAQEIWRQFLSKIE
ncbi:MAG: hypothetical protein WBM32_06080 [Crocosphaera sp.]